MMMENLSLIDICSSIQSALFGVPELEKQKIFKIFESKVEGSRTILNSRKVGKGGNLKLC